MPLPLQKKRELLFLALFAITYPPLSDMSPEDEQLFDLLMETLHTTRKNCKEALIEAQKILPSIPAFDAQIQAQSKAFSLERIPHVEKTIIRLALFEKSVLPANICIAEALRLSKKFATDEARTFVHALLDAIFSQDKTE
jgi:transcription termination factor NusB